LQRRGKGELDMIGIPIGLFLFNAGEWAAHKYLLHGLGVNKDSFFSFHFHEHHQAVRKHGGYDPHYERSVFGRHAQGREAMGLVAVGLAHLPLFPVAPFYTATVWYSLRRYHQVHRRSHLDPEWARTHVPWHYDHHMGANQHCNWGVTRPWFDVLVGTRKRYVGTPKELAARARNDRRFAAAQSAQSATPAGPSAAERRVRVPLDRRLARLARMARRIVQPAVARAA
jgi:hypothetical protein